MIAPARVFVLALVGCGGAPEVKQPPSALPGCGMPSNWRLEDLAYAAADADYLKMSFGGTAHVEEVHVLAWQQDIEQRVDPLRIDSALVWVKTSEPMYTIANLFRHPDDRNASWELAVVDDLPAYEESTSSASRPTHADLERFLGHTAWPFTPRRGFKMTGSGVCAQAWHESFGEAPWHAYTVPVQ